LRFEAATVTLQDLKYLVEFHYWARDRMLDALEPLSAEQFTRDLGSSFRSIRETAAHLYFAEWAWHSRWHGTSPRSWPDPAMFPDVAALRQTWRELETGVRAFVDNLGEQGIDRVFEYTLLSGKPGKSEFWQMLQHVVNHGTYHRGQVTTMLRQLGAAPPASTDLVTFYRERGL
jgi:uncharacterized damage-inducible protein DinB